ncbi:uncharacterized protein NKAPD1 [Eublepharis macularius]|uniref:Uncharacterized protein NKAPD1 n=1 Tax=Eublepharis macularius TaxID=481883 RepID=A0AA97KCV4_EUBMA|nr:uncharacterized protein NKAPD1 [Eublepharis macularius]XP_054853830.1 uncharacterized protein NKAPD1 [Eublepharis macularius]
MSRVPLGKVLLRNVIRHTDAHNKIQEESEMWKIREMEKQTEEIHWGKQKSSLSNSSSSRMRSDGFDEESQHAGWKVKNFAPVSVATEDDLRHARYWNKKLYECEASMPDRWGHSGYKELYPEEFDTDSDHRERDEQNSVNGKRKSQPGRRSSLDPHKKKKTKKSHKKKRKKKSHKKRKKKKQEQPSTASDSSQESECSEAGASGTGKQKRRHKKARKVLAKQPASSSGQDSDFSSSQGSEPKEKPEKQPKKKRRKRCASPLERCSEGVQEKRSKRKNWKVAADENSEDSSEED